jgi:hypothetical protein
LMLTMNLIFNADRESSWASATAHNGEDEESQSAEESSTAVKIIRIARAGHELTRIDKRKDRWDGQQFTRIKSDF